MAFRKLPIRTGGGASNSDISAFQLLKVGKDKIRVYAGMVNNQIPSGFSLGDTPKYILNNISGQGYVYLVVTVDTSSIPVQITSLSVDFGDAVPDDTDNVGYLALGSYGVNDGGSLVVTSTIGIGNQSYAYCGGNHYFDPA